MAALARINKDDHVVVKCKDCTNASCVYGCKEDAHYHKFDAIEALPLCNLCKAEEAPAIVARQRRRRPEVLVEPRPVSESSAHDGAQPAVAEEKDDIVPAHREIHELPTGVASDTAAPSESGYEPIDLPFSPASIEEIPATAPVSPQPSEASTSGSAEDLPTTVPVSPQSTSTQETNIPDDDDSDGAPAPERVYVGRSGFFLPLSLGGGEMKGATSSNSAAEGIPSRDPDDPGPAQGGPPPPAEPGPGGLYPTKKTVIYQRRTGNSKGVSNWVKSKIIHAMNGQFSLPKSGIYSDLETRRQYAFKVFGIEYGWTEIAAHHDLMTGLGYSETMLVPVYTDLVDALYAKLNGMSVVDEKGDMSATAWNTVLRAAQGALDKKYYYTTDDPTRTDLPLTSVFNDTIVAAVNRYTWTRARLSLVLGRDPSAFGFLQRVLPEF